MSDEISLGSIFKRAPFREAAARMRITTYDMPLAIKLRDGMIKEGIEPYRLFDRVWHVEKIESELVANRLRVVIDLVELHPIDDGTFTVSEAFRTDPDAAP